MSCSFEMFLSILTSASFTSFLIKLFNHGMCIEDSAFLVLFVRSSNLVLESIVMRLVKRHLFSFWYDSSPSFQSLRSVSLKFLNFDSKIFK